MTARGLKHNNASLQPQCSGKKMPVMTMSDIWLGGKDVGVKAKKNSVAKKVSWYFSRSLSIQPGVCIYSQQSNTM